MPSPEDLSDPGIEPAFLVSPALAGGFFTISTTWEALTPQPLARLRFLIRKMGIIAVVTS